MTLPTFLAQIAFASDFDATPAWTDVTPWLLAFDSERGRSGPLDVCDPGTASFVFDNTDGRFDPDDINKPYYGNLRPMKIIRLSATSGATTQTLFTGYIDSMTRTFPGGDQDSVVTVEATDRFKALARRTVTASMLEEPADDRITALLASVPFKTINTDSYSARTVAAHEYDTDDILSSAQEAARSDGGVLFVDSAGTVVFQTATFRQTNTRATTSQGRYGNDATAIPAEGDLTSVVDDSLMANTVRLTDAAGLIHQENDPAAALVDGDIELDLGSTQLSISSQADDRVIEVLNLLIDAKPRWSAVTLNGMNDDDAAQHCLLREISDRVTIAFIHPGQAVGWARDQFIESVRHSVVLDDDPEWTTTFGLSGLPGAASNGRVAIP